MDNIVEDDSTYPRKPYHSSNRPNYPHHHHRQAPYHLHHHNRQVMSNRYEEEAEEDEEMEEYDVVGNDMEDEEEEEEEDIDAVNGYVAMNVDSEEEELERNVKKRKLRSLTRGNRSPVDEFSEHATFVLLEVWGDKFLQLGRKSLRSEDWNDVAEKFSEEVKVERSVEQCRSMLDRLKRRYKKEKSRIDEMGLSSSKWAYYKKMDMLMASSVRQEYGLSCGMDSGEYVFMNTRVYLDRSNGLDEMRDSPGESETSEDDSDGLPPRRGMGRGVDDGGGGGGESFRELADSIQKFGKIYEKIENRKRRQMMELERMRLDFNRELELQKKQILERAQAQIANLQEGDEDDSDTSTENASE